MTVAYPKAQEPSMEEILASIRRIIADDQDAPRHPPPRPVAPMPPPEPPRAQPWPDAAETRSAEPAPAAEPDPEPAPYEPDPEPVDLDAADLEEPPAAEPSQPGKETNMDAQLHVVG